MFYILFYESEVIICKDFDEVMELIVVGWTFTHIPPRYN